jgi:2-polyprenyl-3-methyl-5-hydroxy-6-metoxy-1,4-benzoquinol methylase
MQELEIPEATESVPCPLCGESAGLVVGEKGRFNMPVRNVCCETCATVYVTPRPSAQAMADYYRSTYRQHYGGVGYVGESGSPVSPDQPGYEAALLRWHSQQAENAATLADPKPGASVLEIGCRHGKTLSLMQARRGIVPFGIEPGENEAEQARQAGIECFTGALEDFDPGERRFDLVQWFHVLEHVQDPLAALVKLRSLLTPGGTLLVEVPNVYQPYGLLEENFFQNVHLVSYSPNTLPALLRRAGFDVRRVVDVASLFVVATPRALGPDVALPLPFASHLLAAPEQDARWVATRVRSYGNLEKLKLLLTHQGPSAALSSTIVRALGFPAFSSHLVDCCAFFVETFIQHGRLADALNVTLAVALGPHPQELRAQFRSFAERLGAPAEVFTAAAEPVVAH